MAYPTWEAKQTGATRYSAETVAQTLNYYGKNNDAEALAVAPASSHLSHN